MKRRIAVLVLAVFGLLAAGWGPANAGLGTAVPDAGTTSAGGYWACVAVYAADLGLCVENPLPERLPLP